MTIHEHLGSLNACEKAQIWASTRLTGQQCWDECERIDWILWWTAVTGQTEEVIKTTKKIATNYVADATIASYTAQKLLNMKIAKENLVCPFVG